MFFPEDHLERATPEETRITSLHAEAYPDGRRLRVTLEMTPFQKRPYLEVLLRDADNVDVASAAIVEPLSWKLEITMHVRGQTRDPHTLEVKLYYPDGPSAPSVTCTVDVGTAE
jgi:hypothetical protein